MSSKSVLQECGGVRSVLQDIKLECPRRSVKRDCLTRVSSKKCLKLLSSMSVPEECQVRESYKNVK